MKLRLQEREYKKETILLSALVFAVILVKKQLTKKSVFKANWDFYQVIKYDAQNLTLWLTIRFIFFLSGIKFLYLFKKDNEICILRVMRLYKPLL